jgi:hypothetical protein
MARSKDEIKEEVYRVFSTLPEGRYLWGMRAYGKDSRPVFYLNLMTVNANTGALLTAELGGGVTVKAKAGAKGAGWRHVASRSDGGELWISDSARYFAFKVADDAELTDELCEEGMKNLEEIAAIAWTHKWTH